MKREGQKTKSFHPSLVRSLMYGTAVGALGALTSAVPAIAQAQPNIETVVVTGSNIRGAAPVGQGVISVGRAEIEDSAAVSAAQLLQSSVPQLNGFGTPAQASQGAFEPKIHSVGGGSSASTLTLVDGHRVPASGGMYRISDPNVIAPAAIERVEVLPDGASAIYGSDAVAGVINIITRKNYNGMESNTQYGIADHYSTFDFNQVFGHAWDGGSVIATYAYSNRSNLLGGQRPQFVGANKSNTGPGALNDGGTNFNTFNCDVATLVPSGTSGIVYPFPYTASQTSATGNGICDTTPRSDLLPSEVSHRAFVSLRQKLSDSLNVSVDMNFSSRINFTRQTRGSEATVTVYGPGSGKGTQINPFFIGPSAAVTQETVSFNLDSILAGAGFPQGGDERGSQDAYVTTQVDYDLGHEWAVSLTGTAGYGSGAERNSNKICIPCTNLALNGSVAANGNQATNASGNAQGAVTLVTQALTTANALNVWGTLGAAKAGTNTSAGTLASLVDSSDNATDLRTLDDVVLKFDGPLDFLFTLPAGDIKVALGVEYSYYGSLSQSSSNSGAGPSSTSSNFVRTSLGRTVESAFGEFLVPVVSPEMGVPGIQKLDFSFSGRYDKYSDVAANNGVTTNPKVGMNWQIYDDLTLRASWGTSFTAPGVGQTLSTGGNYFDIRSGLTSAGGGPAPAFTIPSTYPGAATLCPTGCVFASGAVGPLNGIVVRGTNTAIVPQNGEDYSAGLTFKPSFLDGFVANITFWGANYLHVITNSQGGPANNIAQPGLYYLFIVGPSPAVTASYVSGRVANSPIPANIQFIYDERLVNLLNYQAQGIDYDITYRYRTDDYGTFTFNAAIAEKTKFAQQAFPGSPWINSNNIGNASNTFSPVSLASHFTLSWQYTDYNLQISSNWIAPYYQTTTQVPFNVQPCPAKTTASGLGCQRIGANVTFDLHGSANLPNDWISGTEAYFQIQNLFDKDPPFVNSASGFDGSWGNPIGRLVTLGLRKKW